MRTTCLIAVTFFLGSQVCAAQHASKADFDAWAAGIAGRWIGEVTWVADFPGLGKQGEKITAYSEIHAEAGGNAIVGRFYGGAGTGRWITVYDADAQQIRNVGADSGGRSWHCSIFRQGSQWKSMCTGSFGDGTKTEGDYTLTISDNGDTHTWTGDTMIGGEAVDPLHDVFRRVGK